MSVVRPTVRSIAEKFRERRVLDARWVPALLDAAPSDKRRRVALWLLSLDSRYARTADRGSGVGRAGIPWEGLVRNLLAPSLAADMTVLELGCGPGFATREAVRHVDAVAAVDTSRGALACARAINLDPDIEYMTPEEFNRAGRTVDFAYSFTLTHDLPDDLLRGALETICRALRPGGGLLVYAGAGEPNTAGGQERAGTGAFLADVFRKDAFHREDAPARAGADQMRILRSARAAGFVDVDVTPVRLRTPGPDAGADQRILNVLTARRRDSTEKDLAGTGRDAQAESAPAP
ncbi:hypothetical protein FDG2_2445 [Candidatus Protofrankia californiensis]|uniref:Methyltransferase domain-containing protein n=1 Tax=Candidatus Protofrankia californiensis TaxID=1839754 RepID=A0A1C3NXL2_9ACTN|nr:hypothetical protein FDG2_2445 [Candidatus Protofrankia californiensis]